MSLTSTKVEESLARFPLPERRPTPGVRSGELEAVEQQRAWNDRHQHGAESKRVVQVTKPLPLFGVRFCSREERHELALIEQRPVVPKAQKSAEHNVAQQPDARLMVDERSISHVMVEYLPVKDVPKMVAALLLEN